MRTGVSAAVFLVFIVAQVAGRSYCYGSKKCTIDANCTQNMGGITTAGMCCSGMCTMSSKTVYRGDACDNKCTFCDSSLSLTCVGGVCKAPKSNQDCNCTSPTQCYSNFCSANTQTCQLQGEGNGYKCELNAQCLSQNCSTAGKCQADQLGGSCQTTNYPDTCVSGAFCPNWGSDPRSKICRAFSGQGEDCMSNSNCKSGLYCFGKSTTPNFGTCLPNPKLNGPCYNTNQTDSLCGTTDYVCNNDKCIESNSLNGGANCSIDDACASQLCNTTTWTCEPVIVDPVIPVGQPCNDTTSTYCASNSFCIGPQWPTNYNNATCTGFGMVPDGGQCYGYSLFCQSGSVCNSTSPTVCYRIAGKPCVANSTMSDTAQCAQGFQCSCDNTCQVPPDSPNSPSCNAQQSAWSALGYPSSMNPLTMPSKVLNAYADYTCCNYCKIGSFSNVRTSQTGWQISCDSGNFKISAWSNCNLTAKDLSAFRDCDKYNGATAKVVSPVLYLLSFLLFISFMN